MGEALVGVAHHLHVGHLRRHPGPDPVHQRRQPGRLGRGVGRRRAQARRRCHHRRQVERSRRTPRLPFVGRPGRLPPGALAHHQQPHPGRPAPLVRAGAQHRPADRHRRAADQLGGVQVKRHPGFGALPRGLRHGLERADLVAGGDQRGQRHPRRPDRRRPPVQVEPAQPVHRYGCRRAARRDVPLGGVQHRRVFDRGVHQGRTDPPPAGQAPEYGGVRCRRTAGGEGEFVGADAEGLRGGLAGGVEELPGATRLRVEPAGVCPAVVEGSQQRLPGDRVQRRGGGRVQVDRGCAHGSQRIAPVCPRSPRWGRTTTPNTVQPVMVE